LLVSDFYDDNNKILFENILKLHKKNIAIDLIALKNELEKENLL
jgi:replicative DNA helicase